MTTLFWDTETSGKWNFASKYKEGPKWQCPTQPKLVQLAAILLDDDLNEVSSLNYIIYPAKWEIPEEASAIHGISQEKAERFGVGLPVAVEMFMQLADMADKFVAHNSEFDVNVMRHAAYMVNEESDPFDKKPVWCTMRAATNVLKLPKKGLARPGDEYKWPKLEECVRYFFDREIDGAHDALVDVRECIAVYKALCEHYGMTP